MGPRCAPSGSLPQAADRVIRTGRGTEGFYGRVFGPALLQCPGRVLDAGAGDSPYGEGRAQVFRVDPAYRSDPPDAPANCAAALCEALPFRAGTFDTVLASFVLQHVADPCLCLAELLRVCRATGTVAVFPVWRPRRLAGFADPELAGYVIRRPVPGMLSALTLRRPPDAQIRRLAAGLAASGALDPPWVIAASARWGMSVIVRARGTTRFPVLRRRNPGEPAAPGTTARTPL